MPCPVLPCPPLPHRRGDLIIQLICRLFIFLTNFFHIFHVSHIVFFVTFNTFFVGYIVFFVFTVCTPWRGEHYGFYAGK